MKFDFKEIKGQDVRVVTCEFRDNSFDIYGIRERNVQKRDGSYTKIYEANTSLGTCNVSKSLYESLQKGQLPDDEKIYINLGFIGIQGTGENSFASF